MAEENTQLRGEVTRLRMELGRLNARCAKLEQQARVWVEKELAEAHAAAVAQAVSGDVGKIVRAMEEHAEDAVTQQTLADMLSVAISRDMGDVHGTITTVASAGGIERVVKTLCTHSGHVGAQKSSHNVLRLLAQSGRQPSLCPGLVRAMEKRARDPKAQAALAAALHELAGGAHNRLEDHAGMLWRVVLQPQLMRRDRYRHTRSPPIRAAPKY